MKIENVKPIPGTVNGYYADVDGIPVRIVAREGQTPEAAVVELLGTRGG